MAKPYRTLRAQMTPDAQARAQQQAAEHLKDMPEITPGQCAYEAYWHSARYGRVPVAWAKLLPHWRAGWDAAAQAVLARQTPRTFEEKTALNRWVAERYDTLMHEGRHGHYETMFRVVQEALAQAVLDAAQAQEDTPCAP